MEASIYKQNQTAPIEHLSIPKWVDQIISGQDTINKTDIISISYLGRAPKISQNQQFNTITFAAVRNPDKVIDSDGSEKFYKENGLTKKFKFGNTIHELPQDARIKIINDDNEFLYEVAQLYNKIESDQKKKIPEKTIKVLESKIQIKK